MTAPLHLPAAITGIPHRLPLRPNFYFLVRFSLWFLFGSHHQRICLTGSSKSVGSGLGERGGEPATAQGFSANGYAASAPMAGLGDPSSMSFSPDGGFVDSDFEQFKRTVLSVQHAMSR